jgi:hypothetical protein
MSLQAERYLSGEQETRLEASAGADRHRTRPWPQTRGRRRHRAVRPARRDRGARCGGRPVSQRGRHARCFRRTCPRSRADRGRRPGRCSDRPGHDRRASRQQLAAGVRGLAEGEVRQRRHPGEDGTAGVEDPGTRWPRSRVLYRFPVGHACILAVHSPWFTRRGAAAARRPGRSAPRRIRPGRRIRPTGRAGAQPAAGPTVPRRHWRPGRARSRRCCAGDR